MEKRVHFKEKDVIVEFYGLKPLTRYYYYFDSRQITNRVKQMGKKLGDPLISDENGKLSTIFYLSSQITSNSIQSLQPKSKDLKAGTKEIVVTTLDISILPETYRDSSISFSSITIGLEKKF